MAAMSYDSSSNGSDPEFCNLDVASTWSHDEIPMQLQYPPDTDLAPSQLLQYISRFYERRDDLLAREEEMGSDWVYEQTASPDEVAANRVIQALRKRDDELIYRRAAPGLGRLPSAGDPVASITSLIERTTLYKILRNMPKGGDLCLHFHMDKDPQTLVHAIQECPGMFISCDRSLVSDLSKPCEMKFLPFLEGAEQKEGSPWNVFSGDYVAGKWMKLSHFLSEFKHCHRFSCAEKWLGHQLLLAHRDEVQASSASHVHVPMMPGQLKYSRAAYRLYTAVCLERLLADRVHYAEIRVTFDKVHLDPDEKTYEADIRLSNETVLGLIVDVYEEFQQVHGNIFSGFKIIYCVPRTSERGEVKAALIECAKLTKHERYSQYIAGFDIIDRPGDDWPAKPLGHFAAELITLGNDIPFLFHRGEAQNHGPGLDLDLVEAVALGSKRIGHIFVLLRHPRALKEVKKKDICVVVCPISHQLCGLTLRADGHPIYDLMANKVNCALGSNSIAILPSLFSHNFYQILVGKPDTTIFTLKNLAISSLKHACMNETERRKALEFWEREYNDWVKRVVKEGNAMLQR